MIAEFLCPQGEYGLVLVVSLDHGTLFARGEDAYHGKGAAVNRDLPAEGDLCD